MEFFEAITMLGIFIGLPWLVLHYVTRWKTAATLTTDDEDLLEDLYQMARRLDDRMDTVERLVRSDHPGWQPDRLASDNPARLERDRIADALLESRLDKALLDKVMTERGRK